MIEGRRVYKFPPRCSLRSGGAALQVHQCIHTVLVAIDDTQGELQYAGSHALAYEEK